jgi:CDP-diacylglycerol---glycerol-3-phosphate 3-phosphatidyltransferase
MRTRDLAQQFLYRLIDPVVKLLVKLKITPNAITTIGFVLNVVTMIVFILGAEKSKKGDLSYIGWGGGLILFAGLFDMLDGQVARYSKKSSRFGALYDSVLDRYSELVMFLGICYYLVAQHYFISSMVAFVALIGSMMVSYIRARAEGLGLECKNGLMQRPERVIIIGLSGLVCGIVAAISGGNQKLYISGLKFDVIETISIFIYPLTVVAVLANITAIKRLNYCRKQLTENETR